MTSTTTKTTSGTRTTETCYHGDASCGGDSWTCLSCKRKFCERHFHVSDKGYNVECSDCHRERIDAALLDRATQVDRLAARADAGDRLDVPDKK